MIVLRAVAEVTVPEACPWWPVLDGARWQQVELDAALPLEAVGTLMAGLAEQCLPEDRDDFADAEEALRAVTAAEDLMVAGGLRVVVDAVVIDPGCCADLDGWHLWSNPDSRSALWLGHDPAPWLEDRDGVIRIHADGGLDPEKREPSGAGFVDIADAGLVELLSGVRGDLTGFVVAVERWAATVVPDSPDVAAGLAARFRGFLSL